MRRSVGGIRGVPLLLKFVLLLAACSSRPEVDNWALLRPDGVTIHFGVDTCNAELSAEVVESPAQVVVTITAQKDTTDDCRDQLVVVLAEPLRDRELINGATGKAFEVRSADS